jgi:hypothetical protein
MSLGHGASVVRDGLVLHLDAANIKSYPGTGTTWYDLSGNGNNAALLNGVIYSASFNGNMVYDNIDDIVKITSPTNIPTGSSERSVSIWFYADSTWVANVNNIFHYGN